MNRLVTLLMSSLTGAAKALVIKTAFVDLLWNKVWRFSLSLPFLSDRSLSSNSSASEGETWIIYFYIFNYKPCTQSDELLITTCFKSCLSTARKDVVRTILCQHNFFSSMGLLSHATAVKKCEKIGQTSPKKLSSSEND